MSHTSKPTSLHTTIATFCKSLLPFPSARHRLPSPHSAHLKWQQDSFHKILNLSALHKEGIVSSTEVASFRTYVLDTLTAAPADPEPAGVLRDKLLFLKELLYAKCVTEEQYHCFKRPLLQRLAVLGAEINCKDVIVGGGGGDGEVVEWSVIDLGGEEKVEEKGKKEKKKRGWGFEGLRKWRKGGREERLIDVGRDGGDAGGGSESKRVKKMEMEFGCRDFGGIGDKVLVENNNKDLTRTQSEPCISNQNHTLSPWCGKKESKEDCSKMGTQKKENKDVCGKWVSFEDENFHPNLFKNPSGSLI